MIAKGYTVHRNHRTGKKYRHIVKKDIRKRIQKVCNGLLIDFGEGPVFFPRSCKLLSFVLWPFCWLLNKHVVMTTVNGKPVFEGKYFSVGYGDEVISLMKNKAFSSKTIISVQ